MSYTKLLMGVAAIGLMSSVASAQVNTVVEPVPTSTKTLADLPIEYSDTGVIKAQHIKPGDVSPEEYARLLEEADKVRTYRSNSDIYSGVTYQSATPSTDSFATTPESNGYEIQLFADPVTQEVQTEYASSLPIVDSTVTVPVSQTHSVVKGDTLYNISKRFGVSIDEIRTANNISGNALSLGQLLIVPSTTTSVMTRTYETAPFVSAPVYASTQINESETVYVPTATRNYTDTGRVIRTVQPIPGNDIYAVLPKDNLYQIAKRACTSVDALVELNEIKDVTALQPGQRLQLPVGHCQK